MGGVISNIFIIIFPKPYKYAVGLIFLRMPTDYGSDDNVPPTPPYKLKLNTAMKEHSHDCMLHMQHKV